jgi:hypothetical protein
MTQPIFLTLLAFIPSVYYFFRDRFNLNTLFNLSSLNIIRTTKSRMRWADHVARMGAMRGGYRILEGNTEGRRLLGRRRPIWDDNIKMDPQ